DGFVPESATKSPNSPNGARFQIGEPLCLNESRPVGALRHIFSVTRGFASLALGYRISPLCGCLDRAAEQNRMLIRQPLVLLPRQAKPTFRLQPLRSLKFDFAADRYQEMTDRQSCGARFSMRPSRGPQGEQAAMSIRWGERSRCAVCLCAVGFASGCAVPPSARTAVSQPQLGRGRGATAELGGSQSRARKAPRVAALEST